MKTYTLPCEKRDLAVKAKKVRNNGFVPAVVYGRHIDSVSIQIKQDLVFKLMQTNSTGSKVLLKFDDEEILTIIKEVSRNPLNNAIVHIEFHALTMGEKVKLTIPISFTGRDSLPTGTYLQEQVSEIDISTLPAHLIDHVTVDVADCNVGDSIFVSDLDVSSDENIEVLTPSESLVCSVVHAANVSSDTDEEEDATAAETAEAAEAGDATAE